MKIVYQYQYQNHHLSLRKRPRQRLRVHNLLDSVIASNDGLSKSNLSFCPLFSFFFGLLNLVNDRTHEGISLLLILETYYLP